VPALDQALIAAPGTISRDLPVSIPADGSLPYAPRPAAADAPATAGSGPPAATGLYPHVTHGGVV
jgi:hypothetical protein